MNYYIKYYENIMDDCKMAIKTSGDHKGHVCCFIDDKLLFWMGESGYIKGNFLNKDECNIIGIDIGIMENYCE